MQSGLDLKASVEQEFIVRPPTMDDVNTTVALLNIGTQALDNEAGWNEAKLRREWKEPGFKPARDCLLVLRRDTEEAIGFAEVWDTSEPRVQAHGWITLHPAYQEARLSQYLLDFVRQRAAQMLPAAPEGARVALQMGSDSREAWRGELLEANGFELIRHFWRMVVELTEKPEPATAPTGITIRSMLPDEFETAIQVQVTSFEDHWGYIERPFSEELKFWRHYIDNLPNYDPALWFVALEADKIVGIAFTKLGTVADPEMGWVDDLGVLREARRRGIAEALLRHSIYELHQRGSKRVGLGVDAASLTGATRLYEKVGMHPKKQYDVYEIELRPGVDLSTQSVS